MAWFLLVAGLALLLAGADVLVRAVMTLAERFQLSTLFIGLTVVALGTSLPEFFVVVSASLDEAPGIGLGNIVGSNIANLMLVLAVAALLRPIPASSGTLWRDAATMLVGSCLFIAVALLGVIDGWLGLLLASALVAYLAYCFKTDSSIDDEADPLPVPPVLAVLLVPISLAALLFGADLVVSTGVSLAVSLGVGQSSVGLTVVALGTSLPELATAVAAARRGQQNMILGNVLGSNLFNVLGVVGVAALIHPVVVPEELLRIDIWIMLAVSVLTVVLLRTGWKLDRREGGLLLCGYSAYVILVFASGG